MQWRGRYPSWKGMCLGEREEVLYVRSPSSEGESGLEKDNDVVWAAGRLWVPGAGVGPSLGGRGTSKAGEALLCWEGSVFCLLFQ